MKKLLILTLTLLLISASALTVSAAQPKVGDKLGDVLYTDIVAYIDGYPIRSYNIGGNTYVVAEDLVDYGFNVVWDGDARTLTIKYQREFIPTENPYGDVTISPLKGSVGMPAMPYLFTDIVTFIEYPNAHSNTEQTISVKLDSFNVGGRTCIKIDDIAAHKGSLEWSAEERTIRFTSNPIANGLCSDATPHKWEEDGIITRTPTIFSEGKKLQKCTVCGFYKYTSVDKVSGRTAGYHEYDESNIYEKSFNNKSEYPLARFGYQITSDTPNDLRIIEEHTLKPNTEYTVTVEVTTENVVDVESPDDPLGACIAIGDNISDGLIGTNDRTVLEVNGTTDENGRLEIQLCLGHHFHLSTGSADFVKITITENGN